jgi:hypothetical protein
MRLEKRSAFGWPSTAAGYAPCQNGLVVHYDGSNLGLAGKPHSSCRAYWKATRKFHMGPARGWLDIGYSFGVCPHGIVMEGRGWQRQQAAQPGGNTTWTSCTFMSGDDEVPTAAQVAAFKELRAWLRGKGLAAAIKGHRDFIPTSCPGSTLYSMVKSGALTGGTGWVPDEEDDMPTADEIAEAVWRHALSQAPGASRAMGAGNLLRETYGRAIEGKAAALQLLAGQNTPPDVDAAEVARLVLADLTPEKIADAVVAAQPADQAARVVAEIGSRLSNG